MKIWGEGEGGWHTHGKQATDKTLFLTELFRIGLFLGEEVSGAVESNVASSAVSTSGAGDVEHANGEPAACHSAPSPSKRPIRGSIMS